MEVFPSSKKIFEAWVGSQIAITLRDTYIIVQALLNSVAMIYSKKKTQNHEEVECCDFLSFLFCKNFAADLSVPALQPD